MISRCKQEDFNEICKIINDGAAAYRGVIPEDRWHEPYMTKEELDRQINEGIQFWGYTEEGKMQGVMGIQFINGVTLIRHAYIRTIKRNKGIGSRLLKHLCEISRTPILIGTWTEASWAIKFYEKHGFRLVSKEEKDILLHKYWKIPVRQIETSVVLASSGWVNKDQTNDSDIVFQ